MPKRQRNSEKHSMFGHLLLKLGGGGGDRHNALWKGVSKQGRVHGGGGEGGIAPLPLEIGKKDAVRRNFNFFHLCFTNEIKGGGINTHCIHTKWKGVWADRQLSMVGAWGPCPPPPPRKWKKRLSEEILSSFTYVLLMKLGGGDRHTLHTIACPHENKKKGCQRKF